MNSQEYLRRKAALLEQGPVGAEADLARLQAGPGLWLAGDTVLEQAGPALEALGSPLLPVGEAFLLARVLPRLKPGSPALLEPLEFPSGGECCRETVERISAAARERRAGALLALGGGKCLDACKLAGQLAGLPVATVPTSAATCACATPIAALYSARGEFLEVRDLSSPPAACLVDFTLLASAPPRLLKAGMADTLAKWLELEPLRAGQPAAFGDGLGLSLARQAYDRVLAWGPSAPSAPGPEWRDLVEANLLLSGLASCLGGSLAAAAHSFCNGFSLLPGLKGWLHGELVAVGLLAQDRLLEMLGLPLPGVSSATQRRFQWRSLGFPDRLPGGKVDPAVLEEVGRKILDPGETIHLLPGAGALEESRILEILSGLISA